MGMIFGTWKGRSHAWKMRNAQNILVGKPEGKSPLRTPRCRREDNIRMDLKEMG
jgi:hypothetical protein